MTIRLRQDSEPLDSDTFWRDTGSKDAPDLQRALEARLKSRQSVSGYSLHHADLSHINLVNHGSAAGYAMTDCDFYRANLSHAHLFKINLSGSSLMKANFSNANLHCANLEDCNLLGTSLAGARLENIHWGTQLYQERCAREAAAKGDMKAMLDNLEQAEEIYRNLRLETERQGLFDIAGHFFRREMVMRRLRMPRFSFQRGLSKLVDLFCGYGEKPVNVVVFSLLFIFFSAVVYFAIGIGQGDQSLKFNSQSGFASNFYNLLSCLYFSVVTFTTLGYGELTPIGITRAMAAVEAFIGSFTMALFVVVFVKKMTR